MKITKIFKDNLNDFWNTKKPTIAFLGDSVTQGCFESYRETNGEIETYFEQNYACKWKTLYENGVNITELLSNKINHPNHEMNWVFAYSLVEEIMR